MDPNAILDPALRYIVAGSTKQIAAVVQAAKADRWTVTRTAVATDGTAIAQLESGVKMTNGDAMKLVDRIWKREFGDLEFGTAPRKLSDPEDYGS